MSKYQLYGLGNGIVDILTEVTEENFQSHGFERGSMTLVSPEEQGQLLNSGSLETAALMSGGSVANSTIMFQQLGGASAFATRLGDDKYGEHYKSEFQQLGIDVSVDLQTSKSTGTCVIMITPDAERTMRTTLGVSAEMTGSDISMPVLEDSETLFIEGYLLAGSDELFSGLLETVKVARSKSVSVALTLSDAFIVNGFRERVDQLIEHCDVLFCNETEAMALSGKDSAQAAFDDLAPRFEEIAVTRGAEGVLVKRGEERATVAAFETEAVDLTGAGDAFAGAYLLGRAQKRSAEQSAKLGCFFASKVVSQVGARLGELDSAAWDAACKETA